MKGSAQFGRHVGGIKNVLDADGNAVQRPQGKAPFPRFVCRARLLQGMIRVQMNPSPDGPVMFNDPIKTAFHQILRSDFTVANGLDRFPGA